MYLDRQGACVFHPLPSLNRSFDYASQRMARPSTHLALPQATCCHIETKPELFATKHNWCHTSNFHSRTTCPWSANILFAHCLDFMVGKELFNEIQPHIILHPFYTQHCVGKTWRGWGPNLLVNWTSRRRSSTNWLH
jgi:hypothetical protein